MSLFAMDDALPEREQSPFPPASLTSEFLEEVEDGPVYVTPASRQSLSMLAHFGFGTVSGVAYSLIERNLPGSPVAKGALFGVGIWAASYLEWIPAFGLRASAARMPARRNAMMLAAHVLWGGLLGYAENEMNKRGWQMLDGNRRAPDAEMGAEAG